MKFELSAAERRLILSSLGSFVAVSFPGASALFDRLVNEWVPDANLRVPLESNGPKKSELPGAGPRQAELLPGGVSGRTPSSDKPERTAQAETVRWSVDKFNREAVEQITVTPTRIERKDLADGRPRLKIMWPSRGRGYIEASCFDETLFPWIAARLKQEAVLYVVHKDKYTNVVGVRA